VIQVAPGTKVYLATRPVSMRYGFDGLAAQVAHVLQGDPYSGHVFIFRGKRGDYLKLLYWDGSGLCSPSGWNRAGSCGHRSSMVP
jgi:transposase